MSHATNDPDAIIRAALRSVADKVEPNGDGYEAIRARLGRPYPLPIAWLESVWTRLCLRTPDWLRFPIDRIAHELLTATEHFLPAAAKHSRGRRGLRGLGWMRPVGAMAVAVSIVTAVVYMAIRVPQVISPASSLGTPGHQSGPSTGPGGVTGSGHHQSTGVGSSSHPSSSPLHTLRPPASPSCSSGSGQTTAPTGSGPSSSVSPTVSPSSSASSTPTPTPSTGTSTPTPTPSDTTGGSAPSGSLDTPNPSTSNPAAAARTVRSSRPTDAAVSLVAATPCASSHAKKKPKAKASSPAALGPLVQPVIILTGAARGEAETARQLFA